jgi:hypothetical protein
MNFTAGEGLRFADGRLPRIIARSQRTHQHRAILTPG